MPFTSLRLRICSNSSLIRVDCAAAPCSVVTGSLRRINSISTRRGREGGTAPRKSYRKHHGPLGAPLPLQPVQPGSLCRKIMAREGTGGFSWCGGRPRQSQRPGAAHAGTAGWPGRGGPGMRLQLCCKPRSEKLGRSCRILVDLVGSR